jgi:hypothetical protein
VEKGLQLLKDNGFRLATLILPSCAKAAVNQFKFNDYFELECQKTKPAAETIYGPQKN